MTPALHVLAACQRTLRVLREQRRTLHGLLARSTLALSLLPRGSPERRFLRARVRAWRQEARLIRERIHATKRIRDDAAAREAERRYRANGTLSETGQERSETGS